MDVPYSSTVTATGTPEPDLHRHGPARRPDDQQHHGRHLGYPDHPGYLDRDDHRVQRDQPGRHPDGHHHGPCPGTGAHRDTQPDRSGRGAHRHPDRPPRAPAVAAGTDQPTGQLAFTGSDPTIPLSIAAALLAAGATLMVLLRRRRRTVGRI
ncbi:LPXTG cell wall anchor domain-containing protein [Curtobacterium flaccumfaciens]|nr:LPXTG cell wall anchor domain-containing protein [Curtobacterium flaccumfaciens]